MCFFYGYPILIENNKYGIARYFESRGYDGYLMDRPEHLGSASGMKSKTKGICLTLRTSYRLTLKPSKHTSMTTLVSTTTQDSWEKCTSTRLLKIGLDSRSTREQSLTLLLALVWHCWLLKKQNQRRRLTSLARNS